jgi:hypothetical protein
MNHDTDKLFDSFLNVPYPGDANISAGNSIESSYVADYFRGKEWGGLSVQDFSEHYPGDPAACLSFMTPAAFRYYFPGFMKIALLEYDVADAIFDVVINKLSIAADDPSSTWRPVFEGYEPTHLHAIAKFLTVMSEKFCRHYPVDAAALALSSYWSKYL